MAGSGLPARNTSGSIAPMMTVPSRAGAEGGLAVPAERHTGRRVRRLVATAACAGSLLVARPSASRVTTGIAFDQHLELLGIAFHVTCSNDSAQPTLTITPSHLEIDNTPLTQRVEGRVTFAEVADLNADGSPEVYVYVTSARANAGTSLVAYAANRRKSMSGIYLPPVDPASKEAEGYRGRDEMRTVENVLVRRFPVYRDGDPDDRPSGGMRQIQYTLAHGEAGWILRADRALSY